MKTICTFVALVLIYVLLHTDNIEKQTIQYIVFYTLLLQSIFVGLWLVKQSRRKKH